MAKNLFGYLNFIFIKISSHPVKAVDSSLTSFLKQQSIKKRKSLVISKILRNKYEILNVFFFKARKHEKITLK